MTAHRRAMRPGISYLEFRIGMAVVPSEVATITASLQEFLARNSDPAQHDRFWADDLVYTSSTAKLLGKGDIMKSLSGDQAASAAAQPVFGAEEIVVRLYDGFAALNFRLVAKNPDGTTQHYRNSGTLVHRDASWKVITWQATREAESGMTHQNADQEA